MANSESSSGNNNSESQQHRSGVTSNLDPTQNPNSPNYLHPGENSKAVLVSPPLNGENFHSWSRTMRRALLTKNKRKFIDGIMFSQPKMILFMMRGKGATSWWCLRLTEASLHISLKARFTLTTQDRCG